MISGTPEKYRKFTRLGILTPRQYLRTLEFARLYRESYTTFDPVEVAIVGEATEVSSVMCHDFTNKASHRPKRKVFTPYNALQLDALVSF
jgi:hypothetical protein